MKKIKKKQPSVNSVNNLKMQLFTPEPHIGTALEGFCEQCEQYIKEKYQIRGIRRIYTYVAPYAPTHV